MSVGGELQRERDGRAVVDEPASDRLWVTARDGHAVLVSIGNPGVHEGVTTLRVHSIASTASDFALIRNAMS